MAQAATLKIKRALISVSDKTGIIEFATRACRGSGSRSFQPGAPARRWPRRGLPVIDISEVTGFPEIMDGRVKTLHPKVHGGLLGDPLQRRPQERHAHPRYLRRSIFWSVNLYPSKRPCHRAPITTRHRKYRYRRSCHDPRGGQEPWRRDRDRRSVPITITVVAQLRPMAKLPIAERQKFAAKAYARTAAYDAAVSNVVFQDARRCPIWPGAAFRASCAEIMRYGENPHQWAGFYADGSGASRALRPPGRSRARIVL